MGKMYEAWNNRNVVYYIGTLTKKKNIISKTLYDRNCLIVFVWVSDFLIFIVMFTTNASVGIFCTNQYLVPMTC